MGTKISQFTDGGAIQDTDVFPIVRSGADYKIAASKLHKPDFPLTQFVDPINGNDTRDGYAPNTAKLTIQSAYDALDAAITASWGDQGGHRTPLGRIYLLPGVHNLNGTRLHWTMQKPVEIIGFRGGGQSHNGYMDSYPFSAPPSQSVITDSTGTLTEFFDLYPPADGNNGYGWTFKDIVFLPKGNCTACIRGRSVSRVRINGCVAYSITDAQLPCYLADLQIDSTLGDDNSWHIIEGNWVSLVGLLYYGDAAGAHVNNNYSVIRDNAVFLGSGSRLGTQPEAGIALHWVYSAQFSGNHVCSSVDTVPPFKLNRCYYNQFQLNTGESNSNVVPFYSVSNSMENIFIGGECTCPTSTTAAWIAFSSTSYNYVLKPNLRNSGVSSDFKDKITGADSTDTITPAPH